MDTTNQPKDSNHLVNYSSSENSQDEEQNSFDEPATTSKSSFPAELGKLPEHSDSSFTDDLSDDENICRSPAKSPLKKFKPLTDSFQRRRLTDENVGEGEDGIDGDDALAKDLPPDQAFVFKEPKFRKKKFIFHPFKRNSENVCVPDSSKEPVEVIIPEQLAASYGLYIWPSAPVLAWYIWLNQDKFCGRRVVELGAGTALPGLLAAKLGAQVTLTDCLSLPHCLDNCREGIELNQLQGAATVQALSWGLFTASTLRLKNSVDVLIGSDLFFDPEVFEPLLVTVSWILRNNPHCQFLCTVQERAADWSIERLLLKWKLACSYLRPAQFLQGTGIKEEDLTGNHQIFLLKIVAQNEQ